MKQKGFRAIGWLLLTAALSISVLALLYVQGSRAPAPAGERSGEADASPLSLWQAPEPYEAPAPETVPESPAAAAAEGELLAQEDGLRIYRVQGKRYRGVLAVIDDPTRLFVGTIAAYGEGGYGQKLDNMVAGYGAVLGVNGGGFEDAGGNGTGATPIGVVVSQGVWRYGGGSGSYDVCAFDGAGKLYVGVRSGYEMQELGIQNAISYGPALILDGVKQSSYQHNLEPRTAVGQREDGTVLLLVIEGRQAATVGVDFDMLADIMAGYGAINATNLDGGASSALIYGGEMVNISNGSGGLRGIPSALLVGPAKEGGE